MGAHGVLDYLSESYDAVADSAASARIAVAAFAASAGVEGDQLERVRLVVSEAVSNAIRHAYPEGEGAVHVMAAVAGEELWVLVVDDGPGLQAASPNAGLGLGLQIMERMTDGFTLVERACGGLEARLQFVLAAPRATPRAAQERGSVASATAPA
jgi:anti-sigma regulatory factor (Ser/Thr protein kinase)